MLIRTIRRVIGSWLAVSMSVMALSACTSGPMTMSEMVCCAEHHHDCEMAAQAESCCAPDLQSDMGVLVQERTDSSSVEDTASHVAVVPAHQSPMVSVLGTARCVEDSALFIVRSHPRSLSTVLLI